jgi:hypothetical protein
MVSFLFGASAAIHRRLKQALNAIDSSKNPAAKGGRFQSNFI